MRVPLRRLAPTLSLLLAAQATASDWHYAIRPGDTLIEIGARYLAHPGAWPTLQEHNRIADPKRLVPGERLAIPFALLRQGAAVATVIHVQGEVHRESGESPPAAADRRHAQGR